MSPTDYKKHRLRAGLTQQQLADQLGVSRVTVNRRENGHDPISREAAMAVVVVGLRCCGAVETKSCFSGRNDLQGTETK